MPLPAWSCAKCRLLALAASLLCAFTACVAREQIPLHQLQDQLVRFNLSTLSRPNRESFVRELDQAHDVWRVNKAYVDVHTTVDQASWQANELPPYQVLTDNVASYLAGRTNLSDRDAAPTKDFHSTYHSLDAIQAFMQLLAADYSDMANIITVSTSAEGRPIKALKVSRESDYQKKGFLIIGGQHAREWISTASVLYLMHTLLVEGSKNSQSREAVEDALDLYDFTFVPTINPDGYAYSFDSQDGDRLWRKTRGDVGKGCRGIDLNRNWDHHFTASPKPNPCSDSFGGLSPFEAPELQGMRSYMLDKTNNLDVFIDLHSFGQLIGFPYAYNCEEQPPAYEDLMEAAIGAAKAARIHGKEFESGQICDISYTSSGDAVDWAFAEAGIKWSFSVELRDLGTYGFLLPANQIRPASEEAYEMLLSFSTFIATREHRL